jgi:methionyl-tRNA formyltransferase
MKLIFAGTPVFAAAALEALLDAGHEVALVLTQPDRPSGRGMKLTPSPVKQLALSRDLPLYQPERLKDPATHQPLAATQADAMIVAAYGIILPQAVLDLPRYGCFNIHASLLPRWRGAAPIQRAILAGDPITGVTIMQMDAGLDTGAMGLVKTCPIGATDNAAQLHDHLASLGATAMVEALERLATGQLDWQPQPAEGITYAAKLDKAEAELNWSLPAEQLALQIRAFNPAPGAWTQTSSGLLKVWSATPLPQASDAAPGVVILAERDQIHVACGTGVLQLQELQPAGSRRLGAGAFLAGHVLPVGQTLALA